MFDVRIATSTIRGSANPHRTYLHVTKAPHIDGCRADTAILRGFCMPIVCAEHFEVVLHLLGCLCHKSLDNLRQKFAEFRSHCFADAACTLHNSNHLLVASLATQLQHLATPFEPLFIGDNHCGTLAKRSIRDKQSFTWKIACITADASPPNWAAPTADPSLPTAMNAAQRSSNVSSRTGLESTCQADTRYELKTLHNGNIAASATSRHCWQWTIKNYVANNSPSSERS